MINPNQLGRRAFPASASQWMLVGLRGTPPPTGLSDGDPVTTWTDSSGNGHTATQTGSARPTFKMNIVNGKPVVRYASANLQAMVITSPISGVSPWTTLTVMKAVSNAVILSSISASSGGNRPFGPSNINDGQLYVANQANLSIVGTNFTAAFHVFTGLSGGTTPVVYADGTLQTAGTGASPGTGNFDQIGGPNSDGDIAEVIQYNTQLGSTDRANLEKYLGTKYGITVAGGSAVQPDTVGGLLGWWKADSLGS